MKRQKTVADGGQGNGTPAQAAESAPSPRISKSWRALPGTLLGTRRGRAAGGLGATAVVLVIVVAVAVGPLAPHAPGAMPTDSATATAAASSSETAAPTETWLPWPTPHVNLEPSDSWPEEEPPWPTTPPPSGWPVDLTEAYYGPVLVGPDGTVYVDEVPLSPTGHLRNEWMTLPDDAYGSIIGFGSDGAAYVYAWHESSPGQLWAFDTGGKPRPGWPITMAERPATILPGPSGTLYVFLDGSTSSVWVLGPDGTQRSSITVPGGFCDQAVTPAGTLYVATAPEWGDDCKVRVYSPTGKELTQGTSGAWDGFVMADDGTVVAWGRDWQSSGHGIAQTRLAILGTDGRPLPGWPVTFEGTAYPPVFGPDGSTYTTVLGLGTATSRIEALGRDGSIRPGWPVFLPAGYGPLMDAERPVIGAAGNVHLAIDGTSGSGLVLGLDPNGAVLPGWPYELPEPFVGFSDLQQGGMGGGPGRLPNPTPLFVPNADGGLLYLALRNRIVALDSKGNVAPGWPYKPRAEVDWSFLGAMPGGGIAVVLGVDTENRPRVYMRCFTAAGATPK